MTFSIRTLACGASLAALMLAGACAPKEAAAPTEAATATPAAPLVAAFTAGPDVKPFKIGGLEAAALRDGGLSVPNDNKTLAINKKKADVDPVLTAAGLPTDKIELSVQPLIVRTGEKTLMFDTGAGGLFGPTVGHVSAAFAAAGADPAEVADIFISHAHGDHIGGLLKPDKTLAFPNAAIHISANEWAALQADKSMADLVATITPKVAAFEAGAEILPGLVKAVDIKGHTPGHSGYLITSQGQSLLYIGDTAHHSVISVQRPDWTIAFDGDAPTAQASRKQVIADAAASGQRVYAVHFPFPGLGKFEAKGDGYQWTAEP